MRASWVALISVLHVHHVGTFRREMNKTRTPVAGKGEFLYIASWIETWIDKIKDYIWRLFAPSIRFTYQSLIDISFISIAIGSS